MMNTRKEWRPVPDGIYGKVEIRGQKLIVNLDYMPPVEITLGTNVALSQLVEVKEEERVAA